MNQPRMQQSRELRGGAAGVSTANTFVTDWAAFSDSSLSKTPPKPPLKLAIPGNTDTAKLSLANTDEGSGNDDVSKTFPEPTSTAEFGISNPALPILQSPGGPVVKTMEESNSAMMGFDTLDPVQCYAVGALTVMLLRRHATDLNGLAFARAQVANILTALRLPESQQVALFELSPSKADREKVVSQCVELVGDEATRFRAVQALLALSVAGGVYDSRSRAFLSAVAQVFGVKWKQISAVELAIAMELCSRTDADVPDGFVEEEEKPPAPRTVAEIRAERRRKKQKMRRVMKVGGITLVGGVLFGVTGGIIAPALLSALAGVGVASAAGLAASGSVASGAVVGSLFGVAGAGVTQGKARKRTLSRLTEFDFERPGDPRVIAEKDRREKREARKLARQKGEENNLSLEEVHQGPLLITAGEGHVPSKLIEDIPEPEVPIPIKVVDFESRPGTNRELDDFGSGLLPVPRERLGHSANADSAIEAQLSIDEFTLLPSPALEGDDEQTAKHVSLDPGLDSQQSIDEFTMMPVPTLEEKGVLKPFSKFSEQSTGDVAMNTAPVFEPNSTINVTEKPEVARRISGPKGSRQSSTLSSDGEGTESDSDQKRRKHKKKKKKSKKQPKVIVGSQGLEAAGHIPSLHICLCVPAWLNERGYGASLRQFEDALKAEVPCSQHIALRWESRRLYEMGLAFAKFWASKATVTTIQNAYPHAVAAASSVAGAVAFAFALPLTVLSCLDYIDNPWSVLLSLANTAAEDLADVLVGRSYGQRPVTLFGYSIGARVIFKCLESLASRGAFGIVDNVFLLSAPVSADPERWKKIRPVVAGRIVNGYGTMDWALAFFHRGCGHGVYVSGLRAVEVDGVENLNLSYIGMEGHKELKDCIPRAMNSMGLGRGYISLPPAKLSRHGDRPTPSQDLGLTEDEKSSRLCISSPVKRNQLEHPTYKPTSGMEDDAFWLSTGIHIDEMPSRKAIEQKEQKDQNAQEQKGKKKSKGWWGTLRAIKVPGKSHKKSASGKKDAPLPSTNGSVGLNNTSEETDSDDPSDRRVQGVTLKRLEEHTSAIVHTNAVPASRVLSGRQDAIQQESERELPTLWDDVVTGDDRSNSSLPRSDADDASTATHGTDASLGPDGLSFDWDLQRRIWEEQERQLRERGYADDPVDIEFGNRVVLGIGVEIAGCRIHPFIAQDSDIPVAMVTEWFTNCCFDQKGLAIRVFEFEKKRKHLPLNPLRSERKYPKLLGEIDLSLSNRRSRGEARFCISVTVEQGGMVIVTGKEKLASGSFSEEQRLEIPRSNLCTMRERREMEAKEKIVLALPEPDKKVLALPAPRTE